MQDQRGRVQHRLQLPRQRARAQVRLHKLHVCNALSCAACLEPAAFLRPVLKLAVCAGPSTLPSCTTRVQPAWTWASSMLLRWGTPSKQSLHLTCNLHTPSSTRLIASIWVQQSTGCVPGQSQQEARCSLYHMTWLPAAC